MVPAGDIELQQISVVLFVVFCFILLFFAALPPAADNVEGQQAAQAFSAVRVPDDGVVHGHDEDLELQASLERRTGRPEPGHARRPRHGQYKQPSYTTGRLRRRDPRRSGSQHSRQ